MVVMSVQTTNVLFAKKFGYILHSHLITFTFRLQQKSIF